MKYYEYKITPVPKPRQTRSDRWNKRPSVMRYRAFCDEVKLKNLSLISGDGIKFVLPMPKSWSSKKKASMNGLPHRQTPDLDNLIKAVLDAIYNDDKHIDRLCARKVWGYDGRIVIESS